MVKRKNKKVLTPQEQVGGKVNSGIMFNMMPCESKTIKNDKGEVVPDKCDKCGGEVKLYLQGEPVYLCSKCKKYFGTRPFHLNEGKTLVISEEQMKELKKHVPTESDEFEIAIQDDFAHIVSENIEWNEHFNYKPYIKSLMEFMDANGVPLKPFPKIILENEDQEGLYIRTGFFNPQDNTIHIFINSRHPKDVIRTCSHELIHYSQFLTGVLGENKYKGDTLDGDDELMKLESDAYLRGNIFFRKWTEECKVDFPQKKSKMISEQKGIEELEVYHGSASDFDKFDTKYMSTGEGNQFYGWGFYVTTNPKTGEYYANVAHDSKKQTNIILTDSSPWLLLKNSCEFTIKQNKPNRFLLDIIPFLERTLQNRIKNGIEVPEDDLKNEYDKCIQYIKTVGLNKVKKMDEQKLIDLCHTVIDYVNNVIDNADKTINKNVYSLEIPDDNGTNYIDFINQEIDMQFLSDICFNLAQHYHEILHIDTNEITEYIKDKCTPYFHNKYSSLFAALPSAIRDLLEDNNQKASYPDMYKQISMAEEKMGYIGIKVPVGYLHGGNYEGMNYIIFNPENIKIKDKEKIQESNSVEEIVNPEDVDLSSFKLKKHLNPKFWKEGKLDSRIRLKLLDIADGFIDSLDIEDFEYEDIIMTGSLANYNWSKDFSDIDLHIIVDFSKVNDNVKLVKDYFDAKRKNWNDKHTDLKIMGFPVEIYIQDINEPHKAGGLYSLDKNKWINIPSHKKFQHFDNDDVKNKASYYMNAIDNLIDEYNNVDDVFKYRTIYNEVNELFDTIKNTRKIDLSTDKGEFSEGNICFKTLRRTGYLEKLLTLKTKIYDKLMSI